MQSPDFVRLAEAHMVRQDPQILSCAGWENKLGRRWNKVRNNPGVFVSVAVDGGERLPMLDSRAEWMKCG